MSVFGKEDEKLEIPPIDPEKDYYEELVGEDKKYKTAQDAGRAIVEKDAFITKLQHENKQAREELNARLAVEDMVTKLQSEMAKHEPAPSTPPVTPDAAEPPQVQPPEEKLDLKELLEVELNRREQEAQAKQAEAKRAENQAKVAQTLTEAYGPGYAQVISEKAKELGVSLDLANQLVDSEPQAFYKLFEVKQPSPAAFEAPHTALASTPSRNPGRNYDYYEKLRKADPSKYFDPKVQNQMMEDLREQGDDFYA